MVLENAQPFANGTDKEDSTSEMLVREEIKDSPFTLISMKEENKHFGVMGMHRITEYRESKEEVVKELEEFTWNRVIQVVMLLVEASKVNSLIEEK